MQILSDHKMFEGHQRIYLHESEACRTEMRFGLYVPPDVDAATAPILIWLSGLTCTEQNFITKAGAQRKAAELGMILVAPDTSPRGDAVPDAPDAAYDLGLGAGFYVDATQKPWDQHYRMEHYIARELPALLAQELGLGSAQEGSGKMGIAGHSMGGHGALVLHFRHPDLFKTVSAFAPIVAPTMVPWGEKAFTAYLGADREKWRAYDACALVGTYKSTAHILIDQGLADDFLDSQLQPHLFEQACAEAGQALTLRRLDGYDHSYYFIASFIDDHLIHNARGLTGATG
ncbi:S-formylglutathione hydrolase [Iodidimonas nitroreducens]|uniref:S-formylglutathione hydrolase n=1 Tax=Iodidimonas nitroreducens TaxID=1236968 RepID=A0A5A7NAK6_9PROT|nr:S-formylglutathione hydrolase [Iodidimonas nitroreducens]GAK32707.1 S-formylglutathione hydrolase [alpha proteobacterium Q-1]GER04957.1 S-formylglutathione hydrolase [Iodidimonas nitroreducens]